MKHYHSHTYFEFNLLETANTFYSKAINSGLFCFLKLHKKPIGPHPSSMIEAHFTEKNYELVLEWLRSNRGKFSVFIHQDTGDDFKDHTTGHLWLGNELELHLDFFEIIQMNPKLKIHK